MDKNQEIKQGFEYGFINKHLSQNSKYLPKFIENNHIKMIDVIKSELEKCDEFYISVAFITLSGIQPLLQILKELEDKNVKGKILTTNYLTFTDPKAIDKLNQFKNIEIRMYYTNDIDPGFHTKGYIFKHSEVYSLIIGSSNMTSKALTVNKEWNTKIFSTSEGEMYQHINEVFHEYFNQALPYEEFINKYRDDYHLMKSVRAKTVIKKETKFTPNSMQSKFIQKLKESCAKGNKKALLVSATGTGKTYASAFAVKDIKPKRMLFIVHREYIARQAMQSYQRIFQDTKSFGLMIGQQKDIDAEFLFATVQTLSKDENLYQFDPHAFDMIVVDEVHRAGASMHLKIMNYFKPKLILGMTASPYRNDGIDIFELFDHNTVYEISLHEALSLNLLCPFHYYGISDILAGDDHPVDSFDSLSFNRRVDHVVENIKYYGYSGNRVKGLIFTSRKEEAKELSQALNERGFLTGVLTGEDSEIQREKLIEKLTTDSDNREDQLDYIITVDIFNEGVDIPEINQVVMLRNTKSPVVFIQQLGRGLRRNDDKEFVVIIDFIGNYENNYMIPMALSGDLSYNKDTMRKLVLRSNSFIDGESTVNFDRISRERIFQAIDSAKTNNVSIIKNAYKQLKNKIGRIPNLLEFEEHNILDVSKIFKHKKYGNYYKLLVEMEKDYPTELTDKMVELLTFISRKLSDGKRIIELDILELIRINPERRIDKRLDALHLVTKIDYSEAEIEGAIRVLKFEYMIATERKTYHFNLFEEKEGMLMPSKDIIEAFENKQFENHFIQIREYAIKKYNENYHSSMQYKDTCFVLNKKYTYDDVCRLFNFGLYKIRLNIGGYTYDEKTKVLPVFINYHKMDEAIQYEDRFISNNELIAISKLGRDINSNDAKHIYKLTETDKENKIYLFVRKNKKDEESKEFYFLGEINATGKPKQIEIIDNNNQKSNAFIIHYLLETPVDENLYQYITEGE